MRATRKNMKNSKRKDIKWGRRSDRLRGTDANRVIIDEQNLDDITKESRGLGFTVIPYENDKEHGLSIFKTVTGQKVASNPIIRK